jgi:protein-tyrosine-phosphatase
VNERAVFFMKELGYDLAGHSSKSLDEIPEIEYDCVVTMGCGDACPHVKAKTRLDWNLDDPKNLSDEDFRKVRDEIKVRVKLLLAL